MTPRDNVVAGVHAKREALDIAFRQTVGLEKRSLRSRRELSDMMKLSRVANDDSSACTGKQRKRGCDVALTCLIQNHKIKKPCA